MTRTFGPSTSLALFTVLVAACSEGSPGGSEGPGLPGEIARVSVDSAGTEANAASCPLDPDSGEWPSISGDGRYVAFHSDATNLVSGDTNGMVDVFVHDRQTGATTRVSVDSTGAEVDFSSYGASISGDGRYVAFTSDATTLVNGDTNGTSDVFVHDRQTGATTRVSVSSNGTEADGLSSRPSIGGDGRYVAFQSHATNLVSGDTNGVRDVFVHDRQTGATTRMSVDSGGVQGASDSFAPSISGDGRYVAFQSWAANLVGGDTNGIWDVFVHDRQTGATTRVNVSSEGVEADRDSGGPSISGDGRYVAFQSSALNLVDPRDPQVWSDIFVHDRQTEATTRVSMDPGGGLPNASSYSASISGGGRYVAFQSSATNLVSGDTNGVRGIYVHDRQTGATARVSVDSSGTEANDASYPPSISGDGRFVAFASDATNLVSGDTNAVRDVFVAPHPP